MNTLIIIPAYNVSAKIGTVLTNMQEYKDRTVIINDCSEDDTGLQVENAGFKCLHHDKNQGMGGAIKTGIRFGIENGYTHIITLDGDGQHESIFIKDFLRLLNNYDLVLGTRFFTTLTTPSTKLCSNLFAASIVNSRFDSTLTDVACGFRGFKIDDQFLEIADNRFGFVYEQLFYCLKKSVSYGTVNFPAIYHPDQFLSTRVSEIEPFLQAIEKSSSRTHQSDIALAMLGRSISRREDFTFRHGPLDFYGFYTEREDSYILQADLKTIENTLQKTR